MSVVFDNLQVGATVADVAEWFRLSHQQVAAVIEFAARSLDAPVVRQEAGAMNDAHSVR